MLAYTIIRELSIRWRNLDRRVSEGINDLATLCSIEFLAKGKRVCNKLPTPRGSIQQLLDEAAVRLPEALPCLGINVATKKNFSKAEKKHLKSEGYGNISPCPYAGISAVRRKRPRLTANARCRRRVFLALPCATRAISGSGYSPILRTVACGLTIT